MKVQLQIATTQNVTRLALADRLQKHNDVLMLPTRKRLSGNA